MVEPEAELHPLFVRLLGKHVEEVVTVFTRREALDLLAAGAFDAVTTNFRPEHGFDEFVAAVHRLCPGAKVVLLAGGVGRYKADALDGVVEKAQIGRLWPMLEHLLFEDAA